MKGKERQQKQITIGAFEMEVIQESFTSTLKWLEFYIEKSGYSGNWQRQISETITRQDLNDQPSEIRGFMETALLGLNGLVENKPDFVLENLQEKFYSWLAKSGIGIDDCPEGLVECLVDIHKVLNNEGKEFAERVSEEAGENIAKMTPEERRKNFYRTFTVAQRLMDVASARQKSLEGKTYKDVEMKNQFSGNPDQGKEIFARLASSGGGGGGSPPGDDDLDKVVQEVTQSPQFWRIDDETPTEINSFGRVKKQEWLLIRWDARLDDYNQEGKLNFKNNPIYRWESFKVQQRFEIKKALNISVDYLTAEEIKWVIREFKNNPEVWGIRKIDGRFHLVHNSAQIQNNEIGTLIHSKQKFSDSDWEGISGMLGINWGLVDNIENNAKLEEKVCVKNLQTGEVSENEDWFIHKQLERKFDDKTGYLIFVPNAMIRAKDLSEGEQKAVGYKSESQVQQTQTSQRDNRPRGGGSSKTAPYIWGSVTIISLIGLVFVK